MAELLIKAVDASNVDPIKDQRGCYKRGMAVLVADDGHQWGAEERLPRFVIFKFPLIPKTKLQKYILPNLLDSNDPSSLVRRRLWQVRWADLPQQDRTRLSSTGQMIIKATDSYTGPFDRTWAQVKTFFRNLQTGIDESQDL